ncbi:hypothetical protein SAMN02745166_00524 [Prosthecobacter debontii]|uniref:Uncharacterized protein n=1 Tax=Prosthecobacter debontii TaxID=48467 RepID=A0A1T4WQX6_9BACT|nr:hypothetical protein SAMN02745166_00524 [Prosthecobacter debontii]
MEISMKSPSQFFRYLLLFWFALESILAGCGAAAISKLLLNAGLIPCNAITRVSVASVVLLVVFGSLWSHASREKLLRIDQGGPS